MLNASKFASKGMSQQNYQKWNYFVLKVNFTAPSEPPSPEKASEKLKGTLSPSFLQDQFPDEYKEVKSNKSVELQLQEVLGKLGAQGWELTNVSSVGPKLLFFFKRPDLSPSD